MKIAEGGTISCGGLFTPNREQPKNRLLYSTVREAGADDGGTEWHIECRLADGQKGAFIVVDGDMEWLADHVNALLNAAAK